MEAFARAARLGQLRIESIPKDRIGLITREPKRPERAAAVHDEYLAVDDDRTLPVGVGDVFARPELIARRGIARDDAGAAAAIADVVEHAVRDDGRCSLAVVLPNRR